MRDSIIAFNGVIVGTPGRADAAPPPTPLPGADAEAPAPASSSLLVSPTFPASAVPAQFGRTVDTTACLLLLGALWLIVSLGTLPGGLSELLRMPITVRHALLAGVFTLLWPRLFALAGVYDPALVGRRREAIARIVLASGVGTVVAYQFVLPTLAGPYRLHAAAAFWAVSAGCAVVVRLSMWALADSAARAKAPRRVLIVGSGPRARRLRDDLLARPGGQMELLGWVDSEEHVHTDMDLPRLGELEGLEALLMHQVVDEVLIALPIKSRYAEIQRTIEVCARVGVESRYLADAFQVSVARRRLEEHRSLPFFTVKTFCDDHRVQVKRALDIVGALFGLVVLSPLLLGIALAVKLSGPGPVLFSQERYGQNKRRFRMYKFRTMVPNAEALLPHLEGQNEAVGPIFKIRDDPRVTPVGRWLRRTSLDELPQLWNVLRGEMSLVGPRPMAVRDVKLFDQAWFMRRFSAPPGMTGLWQVSGRSELGFDDWVTLDLKYIDEWSLGLDLLILARTVPTVMRCVGAA